MAKFSGDIGYGVSKEVRPGVTELDVFEKHYTGDILRNSRRWDTSDKVIDDFRINNQISIVATPFAYKNLYAMRYVTYMGARWKISEVTVEYPRLIISLGGLYNGPTPKPTIPAGETFSAHADLF